MVQFSMTGMKLKHRILGKLLLAPTITLALNTITSPDPHCNLSLQLSPFESVLHC